MPHAPLFPFPRALRDPLLCNGNERRVAFLRCNAVAQLGDFESIQAIRFTSFTFTFFFISSHLTVKH